MNKKIGIITVHKNVNYGANLQAFASCRYLNKLGYDCSVIDYTLPEHEKSNHLFSWLKQSWDGEKNKSFSRKIKLGIALALSMPWKSKRLKSFANFRKKYIKMTPSCTNLQEVANLGLDTVICGSDQIWNSTIMGGIIPIYFGVIDGIQKRISYAASVGKDQFDLEEAEKVKRLVLELDACSVREEDTAQYLSQLTGKKIATVCDPVFLLDRTDYEVIATKRLFKKEYILLYSVVHNDELTAAAKDYADRHGLELVEICFAKDKYAKHKQITTYGPSEFLSCIRYAKTVFTNSFHGTAFSLIFEKDFYCFDNKERGSRIVNLLEKVGVLDRLVSSRIEADFNIIDYKTSKLRLEEYVRFSKEFLNQSLHAEKQLIAGTSCVGCGACEAVCKFDAVKPIKNKEGFLTFSVDQSKCTDCGMCRKVCPALNEAEKNTNLPSVYAFKATEDLRKKSASGGAFAALATAIIKDGGVFYGAMQNDDFFVEHIRGENMVGLAAMQGTKYLPSELFSCYDKIEEDLKQGKSVLFSGTPCQVNAINRFLKLKKSPMEHFYTVDIICHGVPSPTIFRSYMDWLEGVYNSKIIEYNFRCKKISWRGSSCYAKLENGQELNNEKKLRAFMEVYYSNNITRESCYSCPYTSIERVGDLTISDYWGIENTVPDFEDALGVSMVLINNEKGEKLFAKMEGETVLGDIEHAKQPQLYRPVEHPKSRGLFWMEYEKFGIKPVLTKYGGLKKISLKNILHAIKKKILKWEEL